MKIKKNRNGQSLIEVLFSIGIVSTVIVGVTILITSTLGTKRRVLDRSEAVKLAENALEQVSIVEKNNSSLFWSPSFSPTCSTGIFDCSYAFNNSPAGCPGGEICREVIVTVEWSDKEDQEVKLVKFFHKR